MKVPGLHAYMFFGKLASCNTSMVNVLFCMVIYLFNLDGMYHKVCSVYVHKLT